MANRSAVVRIPAYAKAPKNKRFELRNPDATCNPYYAFAAILMAGLDGIQNRIDPHERGWGPYDFNLYTLSDQEKAQIDSLPKSLGEALDALEADHDYLTQGGVFPPRLLEIWIEKKRAELEEIHGDKEVYMRFYLIVTVTFCASGTNIFGAINEGISGDFTILLSKAVMDIFAATLFATTLGRAMNLIVLPQFLILCACFYGARFILPLTTEAMLQDFVAVGGLLTLVLGLSIAQIKHISAVNLLPALVLIWPSSWLFGQWIG